VAELFPIPIQIFSPDGMTVFANRAVLEMWNIAEPSQIVGRYNLRIDPVVNQQLGLADFVQRMFEGETVLVPDVKVPLEAFAHWYAARNPNFSVESMYTDILNFPARDAQGEITHIVSVFITTRRYEGHSAIPRAREYIQNHWFEKFDMDKTAQAASLSRYHFARLFKKHTGMTPYGYYQEIKVQRIQQALRDTSMSIAEAFASCGVEYNGNFARIFRERIGMSPSQYRKTVIG
jgi:AraC-like DNA-binding protein